MITDLTRHMARRRPRTPATPPFAKGGVEIGFTEDRTPVAWPPPSRQQASHGLVLGRSGAGKTLAAAYVNVGETLTAEATLPPSERHATLIVDPKGDLVKAVLEGCAALAPHRLGDIAFLDPFAPDRGFPFNLKHLRRGPNTPIDLQALQLANLAATVSTASGAQKHLGVGSRQVDLMSVALTAALDCDHPAASPVWALDAFQIKGGLSILAGLTKSARARQVLEHAKVSDELQASCASRLRLAFAASEALERASSAPGCIQFGGLLAPGRLTLVDLGRPTAGMEALTKFYANLVVRLAIDHLMERPSPYPGHHVRIMVDEAQIVSDVLADVGERTLTTGRSRNISLIVLSQGTRLIREASDTLLHTLITNTTMRLVGRLSAPDADLMARELAPKAGIDESVSAFRGRLSAAITNLPDREFLLMHPGGRHRLRTRDIDVAGWERAALERATEIDAMKCRLALPHNTPPRLNLAALAPPPPERRHGRRRSRGRQKQSRRAQAQEQPPTPSRARPPSTEPQTPQPTSRPPVSGPPARTGPRSRWG